MLMPLVAAALAGEVFEDRAFYFGDLHAHSGASGDGYSTDVAGCREDFPSCGSLVGIFDEARRAGLDFVAVADHVNHVYSADEGLFEVVHQLALSADEPGRFVVVPAAELAFRLEGGSVLGHKNLYMFGDSATLRDLRLEDLRFDGEGMDVESCEALWAWFEGWQERWGSAWLIPHHPATFESPHPTDWSCADDRAHPVVEIYSKHGNSLTELTSYDLPVGGNDPSRTVQHAIDPSAYGLRMGFISATDDHHSLPGSICTHLDVGDIPYGGGLAAVVLDASEPFERAAIGRAMGARHTYATSGPMLPVIAEYKQDGAVLGAMGDVVTIGAGELVSAEVRIPASEAQHVLEVRLVGPDQLLLMQDRGGGVWAADGVPPGAWLYPMLRIDGESWYPDGCDDSGADAEERIWLSPTWFEVEAASADTADEAASDTADGAASDTGRGAPSTPLRDLDVPGAGDTAAPAAGDEPVAEPPAARGCGCATGGRGGAWALAALGLAALRRRRRAP